MVESNTAQEEPKGDGVVRNVEYAVWRNDVDPEEGYSRELISAKAPKDCDWEAQMESSLEPFPGCDTLMKIFQHHVKNSPKKEFLGTREKLQDGFGQYQWLTFEEVDVNVRNLARGIMKLDLCPEVEGEGMTWRFCGNWSRNRQEWLTVMMAGMHYKTTNVGFYDAMNPSAVDFIIQQTELTTIFCEGKLVAKIIQMKKDELAPTLVNLVVFDEIEKEMIEEAQANGLTLHMYSNVLLEGEKMGEEEFPFIESQPGDNYCFSYTSGTTGDSKGVKLTHRQIIHAAVGIGQLLPLLEDEETVISYLPYPHSFEQALTANSLIKKFRVGYYQGDPLKLTEDAQMLKPTCFPSVPRLYNKIYSKITGTFNAATGCKKFLITKAMASKTAASQRGVYTSGCWDKLVFKKVSGVLGGRVKIMITGSAPIDSAVIQFLKVAFCAPVVEGYGLTESAAGSVVTDVRDPNAGHVGGPIPSLRLRLRDVPDMNYLSTDKPYPRGEVCMKGPAIFSGYYKREDKTAECFDENGWFCTGDVGMIYPNGSLKIIDRSKNIFKLSQGEYIAPEKMENIFVLSKFVEQSFVYGDSLRHCCVAIVVASEVEAKEFAKQSGIAEDKWQEVLENADFKKLVLDDMNRLAAQNNCTSLEKPKAIHLREEPFTIENEHLTPTFKLKRHQAKAANAEAIEAMYAEIPQ